MSHCMGWVVQVRLVLCEYLPLGQVTWECLCVWGGLWCIVCVHIYGGGLRGRVRVLSPLGLLWGPSGVLWASLLPQGQMPTLGVHPE